MDKSERDFDASERAKLREMMDLVHGNGKPGLTARVRRIEWLIYVVLAGIITLWIEGRIRFHEPADPPPIVAPEVNDEGN